MAGIPFEVIDNPFIRDLFQELNPKYTPPLRTTLSDRLLDQEVARVSQNIEKELEISDHLTLSKNLSFNIKSYVCLLKIYYMYVIIVYSFICFFLLINYLINFNI